MTQEKTLNPIRRLYDWVISLADKPGGLLSLFLISFAESSFFPIPPDVLLIPLILGTPTKAWKIAWVCTLGSVLGGVAGYGIGHWLWGEPGNYSAIAQLFFDTSWLPSQEMFEKMADSYNENAFLIVFSAGFTIIPYKLITISSGAFEVNFFMFLLASGVSRAARFFLVAALLRKFGAPVKVFIDRWFNWLALAFCVLLALGIWAIKWLPQ